jgi:hypothetical protein
MNLRKSLIASAAIVCALGMALPAVTFAKGQQDASQARLFHQMSEQDRAEWVKKDLERQATMLEIKASQQGAWEGYAAAAQEFAGAFGQRKPAQPGIDAAALLHERAEWARQSAERLDKLAEATAKLETVLNDDQRKVLDRIVSMHDRFHGNHAGRDAGERGQRRSRDGGQPSPNPAPRS